MYPKTGYTEPQSQTDARAFKIAMASKGYGKTNNTEAEVDRIRDFIVCAEMNDLHPVEAAQQIERAVDATLHAEDLGTRMIISGGEVLELGAQTGSCEDIF